MAPHFVHGGIPFHPFVSLNTTVFENCAKFRDTYDLVANAIVAFMGLIHVVVLGTALGWPILPGRSIAGGVGLLIFALFPAALPSAIVAGAIAGVVLITVVYSFIAWKQETSR